ncbi:PIN domain-containing protein [Candidatus Bipolaricaulota bacterium]
MESEVDQSPGAQDEPIRAILDTNQWVSSSMLRSPGGDALLYAIIRTRASLCLPEIVETEIAARATDVANEAAEVAQRKLLQVQRFLGKPIGADLPCRDEIMRAIEERIRGLGPMIERVPLSLGHTRRALARVVAGHPPSNSKHEEFRDAAIWEAAIECARNGRVLFVTSDKGFFEERTPSKGLAQLLLDEVETLGLRLEVFPDVMRCAARLGEEAPRMNVRILRIELAKATRAQVRHAANQRRFSLGRATVCELVYAPTDSPPELAVDFSIVHKLRDLSSGADQERLSAQVVARGECIYNSDSHDITDVEFSVMEFSWVDPDGERRVARTHFANLTVEASTSLAMEKDQ